MIAFGDFTGGEIVIEDNPTKPKVDNPYHKFIAFNGNNFHEVCDFTGNRYSCVFFTIGNYREINEKTSFGLQELGFKMMEKPELLPKRK